MNILFYYPSNKRTIPIDIPLLELKKRGHTIFLLTATERGPLHDLYEKYRIFSEAHVVKTNNKIQRFILQLVYLVKFCRRNKIDVIHSHLQQANVVAVFARFFCEARVITFRHHCKFHFLLKSTQLQPSVNERLGDKLINFFSKKIIVPSNAVRDVMIRFEGVNKNKIDIIPYVYDFDSMRAINQAEVNRIKTSYPGRLRVIMVSRLTLYKRHDIVIDIITPFIKSGLDIQLLIMDDGPQLEIIRNLIHERGLSDRIHLLGFQYNILNYIAASDVVVHPSLTEASNSAIKEAGLLKKIVLVCNQVGDFNDYIKHGENGFLLSADNFVEEAKEILKAIYDNKAGYSEFGNRLHDEVVERFKVTNAVIEKYENL